MISLLSTQNTANALENVEFYGLSFLDSMSTGCEIQWLFDGKKLTGLRTLDRVTALWQSFATWRTREQHFSFKGTSMKFHKMLWHSVGLAFALNQSIMHWNNVSFLLIYITCLRFVNFLDPNFVTYLNFFFPMLSPPLDFYSSLFPNLDLSSSIPGSLVVEVPLTVLENA